MKPNRNPSPRRAGNAALGSHRPAAPAGGGGDSAMRKLFAVLNWLDRNYPLVVLAVLVFAIIAGTDWAFNGTPQEPAR